MSQYGIKFDSATHRWAVLEAEHDKQHPDRSECGGVGGCSMMAAAHDLRVEMVDALQAWRAQRPLSVPVVPGRTS